MHVRRSAGIFLPEVLVPSSPPLTAVVAMFDDPDAWEFEEEPSDVEWGPFTGPLSPAPAAASLTPGTCPPSPAPQPATCLTPGSGKRQRSPEPDAGPSPTPGKSTSPSGSTTDWLDKNAFLLDVTEPMWAE